MNKERKKTSLSEIANIIMGISPSSKTCNFNSEGYPLLNGPSEFGSHHPQAIQFTEDPKKFSKKGDLLFCVRGSTGRMNWSDQQYAIGRGLAAIQSKNGRLYSSFIKGCIERELPNLLASSTGSVFSSVNKTQLEEIPIYLPSDKDITAIENILSSLERKIELIRDNNETLEEIAKAIFKSWFIDFDPVKAKMEGRSTLLADEISDLFPSSFEDSELGKIPSGWKIQSLESLSKLSSGKRPKSRSESKTPITKYPLYGGAGPMGFTNEFLIEGRKVIMTGRVGTLGKFFRIKDPVWISDNALIIEPSNLFYNYCFYRLLNFDITIFNRGSSQPLITQSDLKKIEVICADEKIHKLFEILCSDFFEQFHKNQNESNTLENIRDSLLPKLISGELRIPDAEKIIEEAEI